MKHYRGLRRLRPSYLQRPRFELLSGQGALHVETIDDGRTFLNGQSFTIPKHPFTLD